MSVDDEISVKELSDMLKTNKINPETFVNILVQNFGYKKVHDLLWSSMREAYPKDMLLKEVPEGLKDIANITNKVSFASEPRRMTRPEITNDGMAKTE